MGFCFCFAKMQVTRQAYLTPVEFLQSHSQIISQGALGRNNETVVGKGTTVGPGKQLSVDGQNNSLLKGHVLELKMKTDSMTACFPFSHIQSLRADKAVQGLLGLRFKDIAEEAYLLTTFTWKGF